MKENIISAAITEFSRHGLGFTMDDVAKNLGVSKKTLYKWFPGKEELYMAIVDRCFADIKQSERQVMLDPNMDVVEKIRSIIVVLPERYKNIGLNNLYALAEKEPAVYKRVEQYLKTDWDATIALLESGMAQGRIKKVSVPVLKAMIESTIADFFSGGVLVENGISYEEGLNQMIDIIMDGITLKGEAHE